MRAGYLLRSAVPGVACAFAAALAALAWRDKDIDLPKGVPIAVEAGWETAEEQSFEIGWAHDQFDEITRRPLFSATRRPAPPPRPPALLVAAPVPSPTPPPPVPPPTLTQLALVGIATDPNRRVALLRSRQSGLVTVLAEGQSLDGWVLHRVTSDQATFRLGASETIVTFPVTETRQKVSTQPAAALAPWPIVR